MFEGVGGQEPAAPAPADSPWRPVAVALAVTLVALFAAQMAIGGTGTYALARMGAQYPQSLQDGAWWTFASATLLHLGWWHVLLNAYFVAIVGSRVEAIVGAPRMVVVFFAGGLGGSLLSALLMPDVVSAGASGGGWGLMLADLALVSVPALRRGAPPRSSLERSLRLVALNGLVSVIPGVNGLAHLGGGVGGALVLLVSHVGGRLWTGVAPLLASAHLAALGFAVWHGRVWELSQPLAPAVERPVAEGFATALVPGSLALDQNGGTAGIPGRDPFFIVYSVASGPGVGDSTLREWKEEWEMTGVAELPCAPGCLAQRMTGPAGTLVAWTQNYGTVALVAVAVSTVEAPRSHAEWAAQNVGTMKWTEKGGDLLAGQSAALLSEGDAGGARAVAEAGLAALPEHAELANMLAWILATVPEQRDPARALALAGKAVAARPGTAAYLDTLAAAHAAGGDLAKAVSTAEQAVALDSADASLAEHLRAWREALAAPDGAPPDQFQR